MPYLLIDNFAGGLDTRKSALTSPAGTLQRLNNCVITPGGEIAKRKAFVQVADLSGTFGLAATESVLYAFTRNVAATAPSSGVPGVKLVYQNIPNASATLIQTDFDTYDGGVYLVGSDPPATAPANNPHYYNAVATEGAGKGFYVKTYGTKIYSVLGKYLYFSAEGQPHDWTNTAPNIGAGFVNLSTQESGGEAQVSLEIYYDKLSIFSTRIQPNLERGHWTRCRTCSIRCFEGLARSRPMARCNMVRATCSI